MRPDISDCLRRVPPYVAQQLTTEGAQSLNLLDQYLPTRETVQWLASANVGFRATSFNAVLALTDYRLIFVAPAPQVLSWRLSEVTKVQALAGPAGSNQTFFVDDTRGGQYQLGADGEWGKQFVTFAEHAIARFLLEDN